MRQPFLVGERIYLRPLEETDFTEEYVGWLNDYRVSKYLEAGRFPINLSGLRRYLERFENSKTDLILAIVEKETDRHIGNVTLNRIDWINRNADTSLIIGREEFRGKGIAAEVWNLLLDYAFKRLGLYKIIAGSIEDNSASIAVLKRLGFKVEGTLRSQVLIDGRYRDIIRFGLLRDEFEGDPSQQFKEAKDAASSRLMG